MRAADTNVLVRVLVQDDKDQAKRAERVLTGGEIVVSTSVVLETEWVLRSGYGFNTKLIIAGLRKIAGLPGLSMQDPAVISEAMRMAEAGMDFADAIHLAWANGCSSFLTFDQHLSKSARAHSCTPVEEP